MAFEYLNPKHIYQLLKKPFPTILSLKHPNLINTVSKHPNLNPPKQYQHIILNSLIIPILPIQPTVKTNHLLELLIIHHTLHNPTLLTIILILHQIVNQQKYPLNIRIHVYRQHRMTYYPVT